MELSTYLQTGRSCRGVRLSSAVVTSLPQPVLAVPACPSTLTAPRSAAGSVRLPSAHAGSRGFAGNAAARPSWHVQMKRTQKTDVVVVDDRLGGFTTDISPAGPPRSSSTPA